VLRKHAKSGQQFDINLQVTKAIHAFAIFSNAIPKYATSSASAYVQLYVCTFFVQYERAMNMQLDKNKTKTLFLTAIDS